GRVCGRDLDRQAPLVLGEVEAPAAGVGERHVLVVIEEGIDVRFADRLGEGTWANRFAEAAKVFGKAVKNGCMTDQARGFAVIAKLDMPEREDSTLHRRRRGVRLVADLDAKLLGSSFDLGLDLA